MLHSAVGRHLVLQQKDLVAGRVVLGQLQTVFEELRQMPNFGAHVMPLQSPAEVNFNADYFPAVVARKGPIWDNPLQDVPMARFMEEHYPTIRGELDALLAAPGAFEELDEHTRNAETQFGPRGDDWLTAYMVRSGQFLDVVCAKVPKTCALLRTRRELTECSLAGAGAGLLRLRPGGRLKPHFGNAPRLTVHLALIVPDGEIELTAGWESAKWEEGRALVFDDTFVHSAKHNGVDPRYVINAWICHPCDASNTPPGESVPDYCEGPPGPMTSLGVHPLPRA